MAYTSYRIRTALSLKGKVKVKVLVCQLCLTLCDPMDCSLPGSSVHGILQARTLERVVISSFRESSWPRDRTQVSCTAGGFFTIWATGNKIWNQLSQKSWWEGEHLDLRFALLFTTVRKSCGKYTYHSMESSQKVAAELKVIVTAFSVLLQTSEGHISPLRAPFRGWYFDRFDHFRVLCIGSLREATPNAAHLSELFRRGLCL